MPEKFIDPDEEPEMACGNCAYREGDLDGQQICIATRSRFMGEPVPAWMACSLFFPDPKRWPEADHD